MKKSTAKQPAKPKVAPEPKKPAATYSRQAPDKWAWAKTYAIPLVAVIVLGCMFLYIFTHGGSK